MRRYFSNAQYLPLDFMVRPERPMLEESCRTSRKPTAGEQDCSKGTHNDHGEAHKCNPAPVAKLKHLSSSPPFLPYPLRP
jgi:hypothetical protein